MRNFVGFSLIELLIVIAIVGVIAAIAVPAYKNYQVKSRLNSIVPVIDSLIKKSIEYSNTVGDGRFGGAYDLGLGSSPNGGSASTVDNPSALHPYFSNAGLMWYGDTSRVGLNCGGEGVIQGYLDPVALGFSTSDVDTFSFGCMFRHYNGVITQKCNYSYGLAAGESITGDLFPNWINANATTGWDGSVWNNGNLINPGSWDNENCQ